MMGIDLSASDHTTLSRRRQLLDVSLRRVPTGGSFHLIVDSSELSIVGEGEWARVKHGVRGTRGWKKLHLAVDRSGVIVAEALTEGHVDDATTALHLIDAVDGDIASVTADGAGLDRHLRCRWCAWRERRGAADQDGEGVSKETAVDCSRSHDQEGEGDRTASVEEGVWLPSARPRRERLLPVQVDHRGWLSSAQSGRTGDWGRPRMQHSQPDDAAWQACVVRRRAMTANATYRAESAPPPLIHSRATPETGPCCRAHGRRWLDEWSFFIANLLYPARGLCH
jgi:hypothetical protein